jgi:hypothetical protein
MGNFNQAYFDRVKYVLSCKDNDSRLESFTDPKGWNDDEKEFARNEEYHGIFTKFSNSLKFIDDGADYIDTIRELYGINAEVKLTKYEKNPHTDKWERSYWGYLDLSTWVSEKNETSVKFNSGGLEQTIKARENEQVEIDRLTSIDGAVLSPLPVNEVLFDGRKIFLKSQWEVDNIDKEVDLYVSSNDGNTRAISAGYPFKLIKSSHEQAQSVIANVTADDTVGTTAMMVLANFDRTRTISIKGKGLSIKPIITNSDWQWAFFQVNLLICSGGIDYNIKERKILVHYGAGTPDMSNMLIYNGGIWYMHNQTINIPDFEKVFEVEEGDSVAIEVLIKADLENYVDSTARFSVNVTEMKGNLYCDEDSHFEPSKSKFVLYHDLCERLTSICSNKEGLFYSEYFGRTDLGYPINGPGAFVGTTHGFWVRGFDKLPISTDDNPNLFKPLTTSLKEAMNSAMAVFNLGLGIEEINKRERLRLEPLGYFYNRNTTIKLPNQIKSVKRSEAIEYYASAIEVGFDKGGSYEEAQGLDEPNGKSNFTTIITRLKQTFSKISEYRADSYGKEFARRKPITRYSTEDTQYDSDIFLLDLKKGLTNVFLERKWQDDFEQIPSGIFSPETATNLRFSPFNILLRHGWVIAAGLTKYPLDYVRYGSSSANSQLKTKLIGGNEYSENGNIINSELQNARFVTEWVEFEHECTFEIMKAVQGTTIIQGKEIPNFYGLVEYINERGNKERGFLFSLKPNGKGSWKVLKFNR